MCKAVGFIRHNRQLGYWTASRLWAADCPTAKPVYCALASRSKGLGLRLQSLLSTKAGGKPCSHCEEQRFWVQKAGLLWPAGGSPGGSVPGGGAEWSLLCDQRLPPSAAMGLLLRRGSGRRAPTCNIRQGHLQPAVSQEFADLFRAGLGWGMLVHPQN